MRRRRPAHFSAFDLLKLDGQDLRNLPLIERKHILRQIIPPQPAHIVYGVWVLGSPSMRRRSASRR